MPEQSTVVRALILVAACLATDAAAQQLMYQALSDFPADSIAVEYENLATLRVLPNFAELQAKYLGKPLPDLEVSFANAGIAADDIDEIVIAGRSAHSNAMATYGIIQGRFQLAKKGLVKARIEQEIVSCLPSEKGGMCFIDFDGTALAFGSFNHLFAMSAARQGLQPGLASNRAVVELLKQSPSVSMIRGVADGSQINSYLSELMPAEIRAFADWPKLFGDVSAFAYSIDLRDMAHLDLEFECKTEAGALAFRQWLSVLKSFEGGVTAVTSVKNVQVEGAGTHVTLKLESAS